MNNATPPKPKTKRKVDTFGISQFLHPDEEILWWGQPDPRRHFNKYEQWLFPLSLFCAGFSIYWEATSVIQFMRNFGQPAGLIPHVIFGLLFVAMGFYLLIGRFVYKYHRKLRTLYAVTDQRVLILTTLFGRKLQSFGLQDIPNLTLDGPNVRFEDRKNEVISSPFNRRRLYDVSNTGMEHFRFFGFTGVAGFFDLPDSDEVYMLIWELRGAHQHEKPKRHEEEYEQ